MTNKMPCSITDGPQYDDDATVSEPEQDGWRWNFENHVGVKPVDDSAYIREAVKLADGWTINKAGNISAACVHRVRPEYCVEPVRDALAAQLVRQADNALNDWRCLEMFEGHTAVREFPPLSDDGKDIAACYGEGRTMNTIKAIVDSGVLE